MVDGDAVADPASARWVAALGADGPAREDAVRELHALLLGVARAECARRAGQSGVRGVELDDLAQQAADDAVVSVCAKVATFRGDSRFTTWATSFAVLEVSAKLGRHAWRRAGVAWDAQALEALPGRLGASPEEVVVGAELSAAVRAAVTTALTEHQRRVFTAVVVGGTPGDVVAADLGTSRGAVYKTVFDARAALRAALVEAGHLPGQPARSAPRSAPRSTAPPVRATVGARAQGAGAGSRGAGTGPQAVGTGSPGSPGAGPPGRPVPGSVWEALDAVLTVDPADVGCDAAMAAMAAYAEVVLAGGDPEAERPGVTVHLRACGPCATDLAGVLAAVRASGAGRGRAGGAPSGPPPPR